jgi:NAD(P)-dependent dehydrogenase (short-subunit alcohol dehydrogenase family)
MEDQSSIEALGNRIQQQYSSRVDMVWNVAGILGDGKTTPGPERTISKLDRSWLDKTMAVNVIGPMMLTKEMTPFMVQGRKNNSKHSKQSKVMNIDPSSSTSSGQAMLINQGKTNQRTVAVVVNISARVGSISDNGLGGWYSYRMSKAALNQATRTMAIELKRHAVWCIALHPGTTQTDLSSPFQGNVASNKLFPVDFTVNQLLNLVDAMHAEHSGGFYDWAGQALSF